MPYPYKLVDGREVMGVSLSHYRYTSCKNALTSQEAEYHAEAHGLSVMEGHLIKNGALNPQRAKVVF